MASKQHIHYSLRMDIVGALNPASYVYINQSDFFCILVDGLARMAARIQSFYILRCNTKQMKWLKLTLHTHTLYFSPKWFGAMVMCAFLKVY